MMSLRNFNLRVQWCIFPLILRRLSCGLTRKILGEQKIRWITADLVYCTSYMETEAVILIIHDWSRD